MKPQTLLGMFLGIVLAVHLSMNGKVGASLNNPRVGNALFWCIGAVMALIIGATGWQSGALDGVKGVNPLLLTAGAIGACLVFAIGWLIPQIGAYAMMLTMIAGQIIAGLVMSNYGMLGSPVQPVTFMNILGALVMVGGVVLATYR